MKIYILNQKESEGLLVLEHSLSIDYDQHIIIKELYPSVLEIDSVRNLLDRAKN